MKKIIPTFLLSLICFALQAQEIKEASKTTAPEKTNTTTNHVILAPVEASPMQEYKASTKKETVSTNVEKTNTSQEVILAPVQAIPVSQSIPTNKELQHANATIPKSEKTQNTVIIMPAVQAIPYNEKDKTVSNTLAPK